MQPAASGWRRIRSAGRSAWSPWRPARKRRALLSSILNPVIVGIDGEDTAEEGCLSIPGFYETIKRARQAVVKGVNIDGKEFTIECSGLLARACQHELDHLNGVLFVDHLSPVKKQLFKREYAKEKKVTVIFFGSSGFSIPALRSIRSSVINVVTRKTKPKGRGYLLEGNEVKREALALGLPVTEIDSFRDEEARRIADLKAYSSSWLLSD